LGRRVESLEEVHQLLNENFRGHLMAKAAVEMGCWALDAGPHQISLAALLGGTRRAIATGISLGIQPSPEALVAKVEEAIAAGYRKVKIKIGPGKDLSYLAAVRAAVGDDPHLMADANSAYTLDDTEHLAKLDLFHLMMIEQPLAWDDQRCHAELQRHLDTPICLDESITGLDSTHDMIALDSGRIVNLKPGRVGGFTSSKGIHDLCAEHAVPLWCGGMLESGIGRAYNVALASLPGFTLPGDLSPSARYWQRDIVTPEWTMNKEGMVQVPWDRPGIGVEVDRDRVEDLTVRVEVLGPNPA
jgi:O-succinylbenzoate synthase